jgi:serine/threonine protein kinase/tetratricopeptide (TPR) repeat protein
MTVPSRPDWWTRLEEVFHGALDLPAGQRATYLARACAGEAALREEIEAMLDAEASDHALAVERLVHDSPTGPDPLLGHRLGVWRVIDRIGEGGMGTVYLAERDDGRYEQRVAIKVLRGSSPARLEAEARILGRLSHPHIARLLDAGASAEGSAYLVMEYVDGAPLTTYCDSRRLTIDDRLRLFRIVCAATQHAHQSLVVHRDLKPSNIFVSTAGDVKLLDFGIAKLLDPDGRSDGALTHGAHALTPDYAAPEQLRGEPVTTAADVYVLGAVLYELVSGQRPPARGSNGSMLDLPPLPPPSQGVRALAAASDPSAAQRLAGICDARRTSPAKLTRCLAGDLDRVVAKAMHVEPERRYGTAGQLADDVTRLLDGRPVVAQRDTATYRLRRFVGRHRAAVAAAGLFCLLVVAFGLVAIRQARAVAVERDRARLEASRAARVSILLADLFKLAEPDASRGQGITARDLLDQGTSRIASELAGDPDMQAALFNVIGRLYSNLALHDAAIGVLRRALELERSAETRGSLVQAETLHHLAELTLRKGDYRGAEGFFRESLLLRRTLEAPAADIAATLEALGRGLSVTGRLAEAEVPLREAVEIRRRSPAAAGPLMSALSELAVTLHRKGDMTTAEPLFREAAEIGRRITEPSPEKATGLLQMARLRHQFDRNPAAAEPIYREALALSRRLYPDDHGDTATIISELARVLRDQGRLQEAEVHAREAATMLTRLYGPLHRETMVSSQTLASILRAQGRDADARPLLAAALDTSRQLFGDGHPMTLGAQRAMAAGLEALGHFDEALALRQRELASAITSFGEHDVYVALALAGLGEHGLTAGRPDMAEQSFLRALAVRRAIHPAAHWRIDETLGQVGAARLAAGRQREAEADLLAAHEGLRVRRGVSAAETLAVRKHLAELYERRGQAAEAQHWRSPPR